jgi:hypothetical protein
MKKILFLIISATLFVTAPAQIHNHKKVPTKQVAKTHTHSFICSYYGEPLNSNIIGFSSSAEAKNVVTDILDVLGLQPKFEVRSANIPNAAAVIASGKRYILYNPNFISSIDKAAGNKWASIAILAHEIGHHLNGHTLDAGGSRPNIELEADEFSGFVLRKMGASLTEAQSSMKIAANHRATSTHPAKDHRLSSIADGWYKAESQITGTIVKRPPVSQQSNVYKNNQSPVKPSGTTVNRSGTVVTSPKPLISNRDISYEVFLNSDRNNRYFITTQNNLVKLQNNRLSVLAKLVAISKENYPLMLYAAKDDYLLINKQGHIISPPTGKTLGYLKRNI